MKKGLALVLALVLLVVGAVAGTLAWLTAETAPVVNTFTTSGIDITLEEKEGTVNKTTGEHEFKMIPGYTIKKDPKVKVLSDSEKCYLFVKVEGKNNEYTAVTPSVKYLDYQIAAGWQQLKGKGGKDIENVYYREIDTDAKINVEYDVLKDNEVTVSGDVTKTMMTAAETMKPQIVITAYASQLYKDNTTKFEPWEAWENVNTSTQNP